MTDDDGDFSHQRSRNTSSFEGRPVYHIEFVQPCQPKVGTAILRYCVSSVNPQSIPSTKFQGPFAFSCFSVCFRPMQVLNVIPAQRIRPIYRWHLRPRHQLLFSDVIIKLSRLSNAFHALTITTWPQTPVARSWSHGPSHRHT
jgi:hypothetical protein